MTVWVMCGERKKNFLRNGKEFNYFVRHIIESLMCLSLVVAEIFFLNYLFCSSDSPFFYDGLDKLTNEIAAFEKVLRFLIFLIQTLSYFKFVFFNRSGL